MPCIAAFGARLNTKRKDQKRATGLFAARGGPSQRVYDATKEHTYLFLWRRGRG